MDKPERARLIASAIEDARIGDLIIPEPAEIRHVTRVHDPGLVTFLSVLHDEWTSTYPGTDTLPESAVAPGMRRVVPVSLRGRICYYCFDTCTPLGENTWNAALASAGSALAGVDALRASEPNAFALCRPPSHHAGSSFYGGYCFLNNAAIAARAWVDSTSTRCAILDVDYHHGNGTQQIFYDRGEVLYVSIHGDPSLTYPFFSGYEDETGTGEGLGANFNIPLRHGAAWQAYAPALDRALEAIARFGPAVLIVSLGVDTFELDPIGSFRLKTHDFFQMGALISQGGLPTLAVMEGGYAIEHVGTNVVQFLTGLGHPDARNRALDAYPDGNEN